MKTALKKTNWNKNDSSAELSDFRETILDLFFYCGPLYLCKKRDPKSPKFPRKIGLLRKDFDVIWHLHAYLALYSSPFENGRLVGDFGKGGEVVGACRKFHRYGRCEKNEQRAYRGGVVPKLRPVCKIPP